MSCEQKPNGQICPPSSDWETCRPWDLTQDNAQCFIDDLTQEGLEIAGAQVNVYKLLGVHEQTSLTDLTGNGSAISGGDAPGFSKTNAFNKFMTEWRSYQSGFSAVTASAYIGYDFGEIKLNPTRRRYGIDTSIRYHITTLKIKQSATAGRATKVRVERSDNGTEWYGVAIVNLPNDTNLNTIHFKHSVPSRYWRLRPIDFNGGEVCGQWGVQALELIDYLVTKQDNIQDKIFLENRDRDYNEQPITIKGYYELLNIASELSKFGIEIPGATYQIRINFNACVAAIGRPIVIGDIVELPSETQYTPDLRPVRRYLEVTDVTWDPGSYTPGWQPTMLLVSTQPAMATQETQDVFGDLSKQVDSSGLFDNDDDINEVPWQSYSTVEQTIRNEALNALPERGRDFNNVVREFTDDELTQAELDGFPHLNKIGLNPKGLYVEDAMPPNAAPFTEGDIFPTSPNDGEYHRLVYTGLAKDVPARLYRYSQTKGRWIYLETDKRALHNTQKSFLNEYLRSTTRKSPKDIK